MCVFGFDHGILFLTMVGVSRATELFGYASGGKILAKDENRGLGSAQWPVVLSILAALGGVAVGLLAFRQSDVYLGAISLACGVAGIVLAGRGGATAKRLWLVGVLGSGLAGLLGLAALVMFK